MVRASCVVTVPWTRATAAKESCPPREGCDSAAYGGCTIILKDIFLFYKIEASISELHLCEGHSALPTRISHPTANARPPTIGALIARQREKEGTYMSDNSQKRPRNSQSGMSSGAGGEGKMDFGVGGGGGGAGSGGGFSAALPRKTKPKDDAEERARCEDLAMAFLNQDREWSCLWSN